MKKIIKKIFNALGYDVIKKHSSKKTIKTKRLTLYKTETGSYYLPTDAFQDIVANTIINNQIFEKEVVDLASNYIKKGTTVLDIGANFGQMSILFSNLTGESGHVHSFDADDCIYEIFCKNIEANNKLSKITPHFGAVHNKAGEVLIFPEQNFEEFAAYGAYGIDYNAKTGREVSTITIDSLNIQETISFMKIDIQGGDLQAMQGAVETIAKNQMPILFEYEYHFEEKFKMNFQQYVDFVSSINYKFEKVINGHNFLIIPK
jgi:FkbM family methyltransferase